MNYTIPRPPDELFDNRYDLSKNVIAENRVVLDVDKIDCKQGGILIWYKGVKVPRKGFPYPEAVVSMNLCKRVLMEGLKSVSVWSLMKPSKLLASYLHVCYREIEPHILKDEYLTPFARELKKAVCVFLNEMGISADDSYRFAKVFSAILEYDDAYRFRVQDLLTESSKESLLKCPRKDFKRLLGIFRERETYKGLDRKFSLMTGILSLGLYLPKVRKAYNKALECVDFSQMQFDADDRYWMHYRSDYMFFGESYEIRKAKVPKLKGYEIVI